MISVNTHKNGLVPWWDVRCASTDEKPISNVPNGSTCFEVDTGKLFIYDKDAGQWNEV